MKGDYEVGYGKPPKKSRFRKGQSGNPAGRPRILKSPVSVLAAPVKMKIGRRMKEVTVFEASFRKTTQGALEGRLREMKRFFRMVDEAGLLEDEEEMQGGVLYAPVAPHLLTDPRFTEEQVAELREIDRTRNDHRKVTKPKTEKDEIVIRVASERHRVESMGRTMSVFDLVQLKLRNRALVERHAACHAYFEELLTKTTVKIDTAKVGVLYAPPRIPFWAYDFPIIDVDEE